MGEPLSSTKISCRLLPAGGSLGCRVAGRVLGLNGEETGDASKKHPPRGSLALGLKNRKPMGVSQSECFLRPSPEPQLSLEGGDTARTGGR